jgi:hypothetical protein
MSCLCAVSDSDGFRHEIKKAAISGRLFPDC